METRRVRIFLVDEHALVRDGIKLHLRSAPDLELVGEARTAGEAMSQFDRVPADVLLMDIGRNEMGDVELEGFIRSLDPIALLVLSWHAKPSIVSRALRAGARGYVLKDAPANQILDAVRTVAAGGSCVGPGIAGGFFQGLFEDSSLSLRELQVLHLVGAGKPSKVIARLLGVSLRTIESHRQNMKRKLRLDGHASLIRYAIEQAAHAEGVGDDAHGGPPPGSPTVRTRRRRAAEQLIGQYAATEL